MLCTAGDLAFEIFGKNDAISPLSTGLCVFSLLAVATLTWFSVRTILHSEEARQEAELAHLSLQETLEAIPFGLAIYDPQDRLALLNSAAGELNLYRGGSDLIGQSYETLVRRSLERGEIPDALGQ